MRVRNDGPGGIAPLQRLPGAAKQAVQNDRLLVAAPHLPSQLRQPPLDGFQIGKSQLRLDNLDVGHGIDRAIHMDHVIVFEAARNMRDRVDFPDAGKKLVAEPVPFRCPFDEARDVDERHGRRNNRRRARDPGNVVQPFVGHGDLAQIRLDRAERIVRGLRGGRAGQRVEQCGFPDIREADDACPEAQLPILPARSAAVRMSLRRPPRAVDTIHASSAIRPPRADPSTTTGFRRSARRNACGSRGRASAPPRPRPAI